MDGGLARMHLGNVTNGRGNFPRHGVALGDASRRLVGRFLPRMTRARRAVFYYPFDCEHFCGGSHNRRESQFDHDRDGSGPAACGRTALAAKRRPRAGSAR